VTTLKREEFLAKKPMLQRVVEMLTILDDPNFTKEPKDVEIAGLLGMVIESTY
jgi:hypothetical protein